jgi:predicted extracellular nuclease
MMNNSLLITILLILFAKIPLLSQDQELRFVFYNVENFFDYKDDTLTDDEEFLPDSPRYWTSSAFYEKRNRIFKVLIASGEAEPPDMIGLAEIENRFVLNQLFENSPLVKYNYEIVHKESMDARGIDVAFAFRKDKMDLISSRFYPVNYGSDEKYHSRDILYSRVLIQEDTVHIFINHWPSRWGGVVHSEPKRLHAASVLRNAVDSIVAGDSDANIIITGDFNDEPANTSLSKTLSAALDTSCQKKLINVSYLELKDRDFKTLKYKGYWQIFDQFILSRTFLNQEISLYYKDTGVITHSFLLEKDKKYTGYKPYRCFLGMRHHGGFSDHLPVFLDIAFK